MDGKNTRERFFRVSFCALFSQTQNTLLRRFAPNSFKSTTTNSEFDLMGRGAKRRKCESKQQKAMMMILLVYAPIYASMFTLARDITAATPFKHVS